MLTLKKANDIALGALKKAKELGLKVSIAVVDDRGTLVVFHKMDGAFPVSPDFALTKAYTSATLRLPTGGMSQYAIPGKPYYGLNSLASGVFTTIAGGVPILDGKKVIGGIGVGGSHDVAQDVECAESGLKAYNNN